YVRKAEGTNEVGGVVPHRIDGVGRLAARAGDTGIVEKDHRAVHGKAVGDCGSQWSIPPRKCCMKSNGSRVSLPSRRNAKRIPFASTNCVGAVTCVCVIRSLLLRAGHR